MRPTLALLFLLFLPSSAAAYTVSAQDGEALGSISAPVGESLHIQAQGTLILQGTLSTHASQQAGSSGPDIVIEGASTVILLPTARLEAADGQNGLPAAAQGLALGGPGGNGGSILIDAPFVHVAPGAVLQPGNGGAGGDAFATGWQARAYGGAGGYSGVLRLPESDLSPSFIPALVGGSGGTATAQGDSCDGRPGSDSRVVQPTATIGDGQEANATGGEGHCAPFNGGRAGKGGNAYARGGNGGLSMQGTGGRGGNALAYPGTGGKGFDACFPTYEEGKASGVEKSGDGGYHGDYQAYGGHGGNATIGGDGGWAYVNATDGPGGDASPPIDLGDSGGADPNGTFAIEGGDGGDGVLNGGDGGGASGNFYPAEGGHYCDTEYPSSFIPLPPWLVAIALVLATWRRLSR